MNIYVYWGKIDKRNAFEVSFYSENNKTEKFKYLRDRAKKILKEKGVKRIYLKKITED